MIATRPLLQLAEEQPRSRGRRWLGSALLSVLLLVVAGAGWWGYRQLEDLGRSPVCRATASGSSFEWDTDQASNAAVITAIALRRALPPRAATIALATAMQESKVRNIRYGDRDSVGLFQQRPSQGWGTVDQIMNPEYSTNKFYDALVKIKAWQTRDIAEAAQAVQHSAAGSAYRQHEAKARVTASALSGFSPGGMVCMLKAPTHPGSARTVADLLQADLGLAGSVTDSTVTVATTRPDQAWAVGAWAVARASDTGVLAVTVGDRTWTRTYDEDALTWPAAGTPAPTNTVVITVR